MLTKQCSGTKHVFTTDEKFPKHGITSRTLAKDGGYEFSTVEVCAVLGKHLFFRYPRFPKAIKEYQYVYVVPYAKYTSLTELEKDLLAGMEYDDANPLFTALYKSKSKDSASHSMRSEVGIPRHLHIALLTIYKQEGWDLGYVTKTLRNM